MRSVCVFISLALALGCGGCSGFNSLRQAVVASSTPGTPDLMRQYGCPTCHVIPHVPGAVGKVGPSLDNLKQRSYLAGTLQNSPRNLVLWIRYPQQVHPGSAMPDMGVTAPDAEQIAAYLLK